MAAIQSQRGGPGAPLSALALLTPLPFVLVVLGIGATHTHLIDYSANPLILIGVGMAPLPFVERWEQRRYALTHEDTLRRQLEAYAARYGEHPPEMPLPPGDGGLLKHWVERQIRAVQEKAGILAGSAIPKTY